MKCQNLLSGKIREKYFKISSAEGFSQNAKRLSVETFKANTMDDPHEFPAKISMSFYWGKNHCFFVCFFFTSKVRI